ncbi:hypothetical protein P4O66_021919 [Electrophorus voltai]|uniref:Uncharacterized protein n=1 Tax=Electrophorus voltai TaxID=2609070 RepID=A0AAD8ZRK6_9TELE|nr:hypothetical protein P4O66_021919 [Electrophorus voltai]
MILYAEATEVCEKKKDIVQKIYSCSSKKSISYSFLKLGGFFTGIVTQDDILYHLNNKHNKLDHDKVRYILQYLHSHYVVHGNPRFEGHSVC